METNHISPLKIDYSTIESSYYNTGKKFYKSKEDYVGTLDEKNIAIEDKVNEAQIIVQNAKKTLEKMKNQEKISQKTSFKLVDYESIQKLYDVTLIEFEMKNSVRVLEKQVKELKDLTCELLNPGYYRRNEYPHPWRLARNYN
jgi:sporulation protein YlmC with PRC-barrel domain